MGQLVYSNLLIAAGAALVTHETYLLLGAAPRWDPLLVVVFCATLLVYNLDRLAETSSEDEVDGSERHHWIERHRGALRAIAAAAALGTGIAAMFLSYDILLGLVALGVAAFTYSLPVLVGASGWFRLKDVAGLKIFVITAVWTGATAGLPALQIFDDPTRPVVAVTLVERALFIFALTLPFDIRDMRRDRASDIQTIPLMIGTEWTRNLAVALMVLFGVLAVGYRGGSLPSSGLPLLASAGISAALLSRASPDRSELYYVGQLDGMIALQGGIVWGWLAAFG